MLSLSYIVVVLGNILNQNSTLGHKHTDRHNHNNGNGHKASWKTTCCMITACLLKLAAANVR